jgi:hypothetical protein
MLSTSGGHVHRVTIDETSERQLQWLADMLRNTHGADAGAVARKLFERTLEAGNLDASACWAAVLGLLDGPGVSHAPAEV